MKLEVSTIKIEMTAKEGEELRLELLEIFRYWADAVISAGGNATEEWLMTDYPNALKLMKTLRIDLPNIDKDLPF